MPFDPNFPPHDTLLVSEEWRSQFNSLKSLIDAVPAKPPGPGFNLRGEWAVGVTYQPADVVTWNGNIYLASTIPTQPPDVYPVWSALGIVGPAGPQGAPGEVTTWQLNTTIQSQCPRNVDGVQFLSGSFSPSEQAIADKLNELLAALHNPV